MLSAAAREAKAMKDDYVSVEHIFLARLDGQTQNSSELFRAFRITKDKFLQQLTAVRGNQRVTNDLSLIHIYLCGQGLRPGGAGGAGAFGGKFFPPQRP